MPISKLAAEAAVSVLLTKKAGDLFVTVQDNPHAFAKHFTKSKAAEEAAGGHGPQGYFKRVENIYIEGKEDFVKKLSENKQAEVMKMINAKKMADVSRMIGSWKSKHDGELVVKKTHASDTSEIFDVVRGVLTNATLYENNAQPMSRFMACAPMPKGFVGRSIVAAGTKTKTGLTMAVVIVNAAAASNPQVVTVYPVTPAYMNGRQLLV